MPSAQKALGPTVRRFNFPCRLATLPEAICWKAAFVDNRPRPSLPRHEMKIVLSRRFAPNREADW
jgi:hypothetical protein